MIKGPRYVRLFIGSSLFGLAVGASPAHAAPDGCTQKAGDVVCFPNGNPYPEGLTFYTPAVNPDDRPDDLGVPVQDLTVTLQPGVAIDTAATTSEPGVALIGFNNGSVTLNASDGVSIATSGLGSAGVLASTGSGDITLGVDTISTFGDTAVGINAVTLSGNVVVDLTSVTTSGYASTGVNVNAFTGNVSINAGTVTTTGQAYAEGIHAISNFGNVAVSAAEVTTSGVFGANGIVALSYYGNTSVNGGNIATLGAGSNGILATGVNIDVTTTGVVGTGGDGSAGIAAFGTGTVAIDSAAVGTRGADAVGILAIVQPQSPGASAEPQDIQDIMVTAGLVTTSGTGSAGIVAINSAGGAVTITADSVETRRDYANGVYGFSEGGTTNVTVGDVATRGFGSLGVVALGDTANVTTTGTVSTLNDGSRGVIAIGYAGNATVDAQSVTTSGEGATAVSALAAGDVSISTHGTVSTAGLGSAGVYALGGGAVSVDLGAVATTGAYANGASVFGGTVDLTTHGPITTTGDRSIGVLAYSLENAATITNSGAITTDGFLAYGILAVGSNALTIANSGAITTHGNAASGIYALSRVGDDRSVTITSSGPIRTTGDLANGIKAIATQGDVDLDVSDVATTGAFANGVLALSDRPGRGDPYGGPGVAATVQVRASNIQTSGEYSIGLSAQNLNGDVSVDAQGVTVTGQGSTAVSVRSDIGNVALSVADIKAGSTFAAVYVSAAETATVSVTGAVSASNGGGLAVFGDNGNTITIAQGGSVTGGGAPFVGDPQAGDFQGDAIRVGPSYSSSAVTTITNAGSIILQKGEGFAVHSFNGGLDLTNTGRIVGAIRNEGGGNANVLNAGSFDATKDSDFGGDADLFVNTGTLRVQPGAAAAQTIRFMGLERFENRGGLVDLRNGHVGDVFALDGSYVAAAGSRLAVDVSFTGAGTGTADTLSIAGVATGTTAVTVANVGSGPATLLSTPITLVTVGAGSGSNLFTLDAASGASGFIQYSLDYDPATLSYGLTGAAGAPIYRLARANEGAENVWLKSAEAWSGRTAAVRDARWGGAAVGSRLWGQLAGGVATREGHTAVAASGAAPVRYDTGYRQDHFGAQLGYDLTGGGAGSGGATIGVTGGYLNSSLRTSGERLTFDAANVGAYVGLATGKFFVGALGKYDRYWVNAVGRTLGYSDRFHGSSYGVQGEAGLRFGGNTLFAEPIVGLAYVRTDLKDLVALGQIVDFDKAKGLRGSAGARVGGTANVAGARVVYYATGRAIHEFRGQDGVTLRSGGLSQDVRNVRLGTYGVASLGLNILSAGPVSGFIEGEGQFGSSYKGGGGKAGISVRF